MRETLVHQPAWLRRTIVSLFAVAATAGTQLAVQAEPAQAFDACFVITKQTGWGCTREDAPTPPPCDVDQTSVGPGQRVCTLAQQKTSVFEAYDLNTGLNRCTATMRVSSPEDQNDQPGNRPRIGYRFSLGCEKPLRIVNFTSRVDRATGGTYHTAGSAYCHGTCGTQFSIRGDVHANRNEAFIFRVPIHMRLPEGPDPWIATPPDAIDNNGAASCKPGGYDVYCMLEMPFITQDQSPDIIKLRVFPPTAAK